VKYNRVVESEFISRPNRFIANVNMGGKNEIVHVKNTGRCKELLTFGTKVYLAAAENKDRKTKYDLVCVDKCGKLINIDSAAPNKVFYEYLKNIYPNEAIRSEVKYRDSRFDFFLKTGKKSKFIEVKGVTLESDGHAKFPDAPTARGVKHLRGLVDAVKEGYSARIVFVIQMENAVDFSPNWETHYEFGDTLISAENSGVEIYAFSCKVEPDYMSIFRPVPIILNRPIDIRPFIGYNSPVKIKAKKGNTSD
jgi:sugar fermentation stimulation protein A